LKKINKYLIILLAAIPVAIICSTAGNNEWLKQAGPAEKPGTVFEDFTIFFKQDLDNTPTGYYKPLRWKRDWNDPEGSIVYLPRTFIIDYNSGGRSSRGMKWIFPRNSYGVNANHGYDWRTPIGKTLEECYLSFSIMFKPGFDAVSGGKIMGVQGNPPDAEARPKWDQGFGGSLMFKPDRTVAGRPPVPSFYVYHQDQELAVGDSPRWDYTFDVSSEIWYDITYRIVMNTAVSSGPGGPDGLRDGIMEGFVNGKLYGQISDLRLRNLNHIGIDRIRVQGFFGGGEDYSTVRDEWMIIDNVIVWTYSDEYLQENPSVKRGRQKNSTGDVIYTPFDILFANVVDESTGGE